MKRISSLLIVAALIVVMVGCKATAATKYSLTINSNAGGSVTTPGEGTFGCAEGSMINLAAAAASGYRFVNWTGDKDTIANVNAASTTITMNADYSITANFEVIPAVQYILTISSTAGGSVTTPGEGTFTRDAGTVVNLEAEPLIGYRFDEWTGEVDTIANENAAVTTITMYDNYSITANFEDTGVTYYTLTVAVTPPGSGTATDQTDAGPYQQGAQVSIKAQAAAGYQFVNWTAPAGSFANANAAQTTFTMPGLSVTVTAHFEQAQTYTLNMAVTPPGSGTATDQTNAGPYQQGAQVSIRAQAAAGYQFVNWTAPAGSFANANAAQTTFTMPGLSVTVTAHFEQAQTYTLNMAVTPPGSGTATDQTDAGPYQQGAQVSIRAQAAAGYRFVNWTAPAGSFANANAAQTTFTMPGLSVTVTAHFYFEGVNFMVAAGDLHTVGLKSDGTVVAVGDNSYGQCNVGSWTNIVQVAADGCHTVGLKSDGTVVAKGDNSYGQRNVGSWTNIIQVTAGGYHTVGLRSNGTVVAVGDNSYGQRDVGSWTNIIQVAADGCHTVGLKSDGTVVATGDNYWGQRDVSGWTNIIKVAAGDAHAVGLKSNGTVVATGNNYWGQCDVGSWTGIIQVVAGDSHTVGLNSNGTVVATGYNYHGQCNISGWTGIIQVAAGWEHTVGLKSNGTVVAVGWNEYGECNVGSWDLN